MICVRVCGTAGLLSSYAHVLSVLHYCQAACYPPVCPDLQSPDLVGWLPPNQYDGLDCRFCADINTARQVFAQQSPPSPAAPSVGSPRSPTADGTDGSAQDGADAAGARIEASLTTHLRSYFGYLRATAAGPHTLAVRGRGAGAYLIRKRQCWPTVGPLLDTRISIEDPFETYDSPEPSRRHDCASTVNEKGMIRLQEEWQRGEELLKAADALEAQGDANAARAKVGELFHVHASACT